MQIADMSIEAPRVGGVAVSRAAVLAGSGRTTLVGLIGTGIQPSRMPALHEREGAAQGLTYIYRLGHLGVLPLGVEAPPGPPWAARRLASPAPQPPPPS